MNLPQHSVGFATHSLSMSQSVLAQGFARPSFSSALSSPFIHANSDFASMHSRASLTLSAPPKRRRAPKTGLQASHMSGLLVSKMVTSLTLMALGDMLTQWNEQKHTNEGVEPETALRDWDVERTARQGLFGALIAAPLCHVWFPILEQLVPLTGEGLGLLSHVAERVMVDQLLFGPINIILFLSWMSYMQDFSLSKAINKCKSELPSLYPKSLTTWVPVHMLTFSIIPDEFRVLWIGLVSIFWGAVLSASASETSVAAAANAPAPRTRPWTRFVTNFKR